MSLPEIHSSSLPQFISAATISEDAAFSKYQMNLSALFELNKKIIALSGQVFSMQEENRSAKQNEEKMKQACLAANQTELPSLYAKARELNQRNKTREKELPNKEAELEALKKEFTAKKERSQQELQCLYELEQEDIKNLLGFGKTLYKRIEMAQKNLNEAFEINPETFLKAKLSFDSLKSQSSCLEKVRNIRTENSGFLAKHYIIYAEQLYANAKTIGEPWDRSNHIPLRFNSSEIEMGTIDTKVVKFSVTPLTQTLCRYELVTTKDSSQNEGVLELCALPGDSLQNPYELQFTIDKRIWETANKAVYGFAIIITAKNEKGEYPRVCQF